MAAMHQHKWSPNVWSQITILLNKSLFEYRLKALCWRSNHHYSAYFVHDYVSSLIYKSTILNAITSLNTKRFECNNREYNTNANGQIFFYKTNCSKNKFSSALCKFIEMENVNAKIDMYYVHHFYIKNPIEQFSSV